METPRATLLQLREALEASWDSETSYRNVSEKGNPALGQCYPTSRIIQFFFPETEIVEGEVWTGIRLEKHFWNIVVVEGIDVPIDFTWQQFPFGSSVRSSLVRNRETLGDSRATIDRCELLFKRVVDYLIERASD